MMKLYSLASLRGARASPRDDFWILTGPAHPSGGLGFAKSMTQLMTLRGRGAKFKRTVSRLQTGATLASSLALPTGSEEDSAG